MFYLIYFSAFSAVVQSTVFFSVLAILYFSVTLHMARFWLMKLVIRKWGHRCGEGSEHGTFSFLSACKTIPISKGRCILGFMDFTQVFMQSPSLFFPGKSLFRWPHLSLYGKCFCMQVCLLCGMWKPSVIHVCSTHRKEWL